MNQLSSPDKPLFIGISAHPDDFEIGAMVAAGELLENGWEGLLVASSTGRPEQHDRRVAEQQEAAKRGGYEVIFPDPPASISGGDDLVAAQEYLTNYVRTLVTERKPSLVMSVSPHDWHHGHEVVGRSVLDALQGLKERPVLWLYDVWGLSANPNIYVPYDEPSSEQTLRVLDAFSGENERNNYKNKVIGQGLNGKANVELVFGFGAAAVSDHMPYAQLLTELVPSGEGDWLLGESRVLDATNPLIPATGGIVMNGIFERPSDRELRRQLEKTSN